MRAHRLAAIVIAAAAVAGCSGGALLSVPPPGTNPGPGATPVAIAAVSLSRTGALPVPGTLGVFPVYVTAVDQNGKTIAGAYPTPVNISLNNLCDLSLSVGGPGTVMPCIVDGKPQTVKNVGAVQVTAGTQVVYINYDGANPLQSGTALSASTSTGYCSAIAFPSNAPEACPAKTGSKTRRLP